MLKRALVTNGVPVNMAEAILGTPTLSLTAAGTTVADALQLNTSVSVVSTTAASTGVILPPMEVGDEATVANLGANALKVYAKETGFIIQSGAADAAFSVATLKTVRIKKVGALQYIAFLSA